MINKLMNTSTEQTRYQKDKHITTSITKPLSSVLRVIVPRKMLSTYIPTSNYIYVYLSLAANKCLCLMNDNRSDDVKCRRKRYCGMINKKPSITKERDFRFACNIPLKMYNLIVYMGIWIIIL